MIKRVEAKSEFMTHDEAILLLPWFVNGSLAGDELEQVQTHVNTCLLCRKELGAQQRLQLAVRNSEAFPRLPQRAFAQLAGRIRAEGVRDARKTGWSGRFWGRWSTIAQSVRRAASIAHDDLLRFAAPAALLLVVVAGLSGSDGLRPDAPHLYRTLSTQGAVPLAGDADSQQPGFDVSIAFRDGSSRQHVNHVIGKVGGAIINGPDELGVYILRLARVPDDKLLDSLRRQRDVIFAEPVLAKGDAEVSEERVTR